MSTAHLDPQPFRDWYAEQKRHHEAEEIARWFGVDSRTLRRWDEESEHIRRGDFEDAVMRSHFSLWDIYPDLEEEEVGRVCVGRGNLPGQGCRVTDQQLRVLYAIHVERHVTVKQLADELWRSLGYPSPNAARCSFQRGFRRLGLKPRYRTRHTKGIRRCAGLNRQGERCAQSPLAGEDHCYAHHPETRNKLVLHALTVSPFVKAVA